MVVYSEKREATGGCREEGKVVGGCCEKGKAAGGLRINESEELI